MDVSMEKILVSKEIAGLLAAMGVPLGESKRAAKKELAYGKIIQLADADVDGMHINTLLLAAIYRFAPWALGKGNIYSVRSPLYKGRHKDKVYFGMTKQEVWDQAGSKIDTTYLKGWGEVSPEDLAIALDPSKRTLIHIDDSDAAGRKAFEQLMGSSPIYRKKLLGVE
jgi:DNA gyrase subunit B